MNDQQIVEEIKSISEILDFSKLTQDESKKLMKLIGEQRLKEAHVKMLIDIAPNFILCAQKTLKVIGKAAEGAQESQKSALHH